MREDRIGKILKDALNPEQLLIVNESHMHSGNREESHFKVLVVSDIFEGQSRVSRQRNVNILLKMEFDSGMHALSLRCLTPQEAQAEGIDFSSPDCASSTPRADS